MDCALIEKELIAYHFATVGGEEREHVEAHLVGCTACLRSYLALKRHVDEGAAVSERPSELAKSRLRAEVAATFPPERRSRVRSWLERPIPLYKGLAAATLATAIAALVPVVARSVPRAPVIQASSERVDTSRPSPETLTVY